MEVDNQPTKWRKYLKLVEYDLISQKELNSQIHRYSWSQRHQLSEEIKEILISKEKNTNESFFVVKLVPMIQQGQLPNFRITLPSDLKGLPEFFRMNDNGKFIEVWYCETRIDHRIFSVAGRIIFALDSFPYHQIIEQVWRCSPRLLETFNKNFSWPYIAAFREGWGRRFIIKTIHIPPSFSISETELSHQFKNTVREIERKRDNLEVFCNYLESQPFSVYSIEYKLVGSKLSIIDWDTPNDLKALRE